MTPTGIRPGLALAYLGGAIRAVGEADDWASSPVEEHSALLRNRRAANYAESAANSCDDAAAELRKIARAHRGEKS